MNKILICCFLIITFCSCNDLSGRLGVSNNINDAKSNNVYISEYKPLINPVRINDSIKITVKRVWLEKQWRYDNNLRPSVIDGYQMILESDKNDLKGFTIDWTIGIDRYKYWRFCNANNIMTDFSQIPSDTITWKVQKGSHLDSLSEKEIIGEFKLVKQ